MDFDDAADELYGVPPAGFVERRRALVAHARAAGDSVLARSIGGLRKPNGSAWLLNRLARDATQSVDHLVELGAQLRSAQARLAGDDLRRLTQEGRAAVEGLLERANALGTRAGQPPSAATMAEVETTLQAALADATAAEQLRQGRLTTALAYSGFGPLPEETGPPPARSASATRADQAAQRAQARLEQRRRDHETAKRRHDDAAKRVRGLDAELRSARAELAAAERALSQAEHRLEEAGGRSARR